MYPGHSTRFGHRRPSHSESGVSGSNDLHRFWDVCYVGHADDIKKHLWFVWILIHTSRTRDPMMDPGLGPRKILGIPEVPIFRRGPSSDAEIMDVCHDIIRSVIIKHNDDMSSLWIYNNLYILYIILYYIIYILKLLTFDHFCIYTKMHQITKCAKNVQNHGFPKTPGFGGSTCFGTKNSVLGCHTGYLNNR